jgi:hypothetical protein
MAEEELTFPFTQFCDFRDLEVSGQRVQLDPRAVRAEYLDQLRRHIRRIEMGCGQMNIDYIQLSTRQSFVEALSHYLASRKGKGK